MNLKSFNKSLIDIYYLSNTPVFLYKKMRESNFIQMLAQSPTQELIEEFRKRASDPISNDSELAEVYAIFVALTFKEHQEVAHFFAESLKIKFEWFRDIANFYLSDYRPDPQFQTFDVPSNEILEQFSFPGSTGVTITNEST